MAAAQNSEEGFYAVVHGLEGSKIYESSMEAAQMTLGLENTGARFFTEREEAEKYLQRAKDAGRAGTLEGMRQAAMRESKKAFNLYRASVFQQPRPAFGSPPYGKLLQRNKKELTGEGEKAHGGEEDRKAGRLDRRVVAAALGSPKARMSVTSVSGPKRTFPKGPGIRMLKGKHRTETERAADDVAEKRIIEDLNEEKCRRELFGLMCMIQPRLGLGDFAEFEAVTLKFNPNRLVFTYWDSTKAALDMSWEQLSLMPGCECYLSDMEAVEFGLTGEAEC